MEFEVHITVDCEDIEKFKQTCLNMGVKPIVILADSKQVMTSSKYKEGDYKNVSEKISDTLKCSGFNVIRKKIEIRPEENKNENFNYYESHFRLTLLKNFNHSELDTICKSSNFHKSKNLFKSSDIFDYQMITYRSYTDSFNQFNLVIDKMKDCLDNNYIEYDKVEIEECILDTNEEVDAKWLSNN